MGRDKVIRVDFQKGRRTRHGFFLEGPRLVAGVALFTLAAVVVLTAALDATWIATPFFGPVAVLVAVLAALGVRRVALWLAARGLAREALDSGGAPRDKAPEDDPKGRTLH